MQAAGPVVNGMATANDIGGSGEYTPVQRAVLDYYNSDDGKSSQNGFDINQVCGRLGTCRLLMLYSSEQKT